MGLQACTTPPQTRELMGRELATATVPLPARVELTEVPYFAQTQFHCGPAALAMAIGAHGKSIEPDTLAQSVYLPGRKGSLQVELQAAARQLGYVAYVLPPQLTDLLAEVAAGTPALVLQNLGLDMAPVWHYAVVVGFDLPAGALILRSGPTRRQLLSLATFERTWARGGHWAMLALPPGRLPATAGAESYARAVLDLERTGRTETAYQAYGAAVSRWPDHLGSLMGRGNTAYALGRWHESAAVFTRATEAHPQAGIAYNNLAEAQARLGQRDAALAAARRAVALGGPHRDAFAATLESLLSQPQ